MSVGRWAVLGSDRRLAVAVGALALGVVAFCSLTGGGGEVVPFHWAGAVAGLQAADAAALVVTVPEAEPPLRRAAVLWVADGVERAAEEARPEDVATQAEIDHWVRDLSDDDVRFNAQRAIRRLCTAGVAAAPALERALRSADWQQRGLAAALLAELDLPPSSALLEVQVEALQRGHGWQMPRTDSALLFLMRHSEAARRQLVFGLGSAHPQQRFLCAFLLAHGGHQDALDTTCSVLIEHLRDNHIDGDALMSCQALYRLGPPAMPYLRAALGSGDAQARQLANLVLLDLADPPRTRSALEGRKALQSVTTVYFDPAIELDLRWSRVAQW